MLPKEPLLIVNTDRIDGDKLIVDYSNKTTAIYSSEQIAGLTPELLIHETEIQED